MIEVYVNDIKCSLKNRCYFTALSLALTLPDMCGMAEYPNESSVAKRYIGWYDKYIGAYMAQGQDDSGRKDPWLSGEIIYNLRNTYLHQGSPDIIGNKVKEEVNQLDRFILILGDGTVIQQVAATIRMGNGFDICRTIAVDITYLCDSLCNCALWYYQNNKEKFAFKYSVMIQEELMNSSYDNSVGDIVAKITADAVDKKINKEQESLLQIAKDPVNNPINSMKEGFDIIFLDKETKVNILEPNKDEAKQVD